MELGDPREHDEHKKNGKKTLAAATPTERKKLELEKGLCFTQLFFLPYDSIRFAIIWYRPLLTSHTSGILCVDHVDFTVTVNPHV